MVNRIAVYAEGPTEWYAVYQLCSRNLMAHAEMIGKSDRNNIRNWLKSREEMRNLFVNQNGFPPCDGILLVFDQENDGTPLDTAREIFGDAFSFSSANAQDSLYRGQLENGTQVALHVATAPSPDGNRDFDGYILNLLDRLRDEAVNIWIQEIARDYLRNHFSTNNLTAMQIHELGRKEIPELMDGVPWNILRSKTLLYAYITALQADRSHVWFSEKIIKFSQPDVIREVFADLIAGWNLIAGGST
jgi:hypothetical protein